MAKPIPFLINKQYDWLPPQLVGKSITDIAIWFEMSYRYIKQLYYRSEEMCYDCGKLLNRNGTRCVKCCEKRRVGRARKYESV